MPTRRPFQAPDREAAHAGRPGPDVVLKQHMSQPSAFQQPQLDLGPFAAAAPVAPAATQPFLAAPGPQASLSLDEVKAIYREAIDPRASDGEEAAWWSEVQAELSLVLAAPTAREAAAVINWWHHDWTTVADTAVSAARRLRAAARRAMVRAAPGR